MTFKRYMEHEISAYDQLVIGAKYWLTYPIPGEERKARHIFILEEITQHKLCVFKNQRYKTRTFRINEVLEMIRTGEISPA